MAFAASRLCGAAIVFAALHSLLLREGSPYTDNMPYTFMPRLPTAAAHANPLFPAYKNLDDLLFALKASPLPIRGDVLMKPDEKAFLPFTTAYQLYDILKKECKDHSTISRIYLYDIGSFWFQ